MLSRPAAEAAGVVLAQPVLRAADLPGIRPRSSRPGSDSPPSRASRTTPARRRRRPCCCSRRPRPGAAGAVTRSARSPCDSFEPFGDGPGPVLVGSDRASDDLEVPLEAVHLLGRLARRTGGSVTEVRPASQRARGVRGAAPSRGVEEGAAAVGARRRERRNRAPEGLPLHAPQPGLAAARCELTALGRARAPEAGPRRVRPSVEDLECSRGGPLRVGPASGVRRPAGQRLVAHGSPPSVAGPPQTRPDGHCDGSTEPTGQVQPDGPQLAGTPTSVRQASGQQ